MALNRIDTTVQDVVSDETLVVVEDAKKMKKGKKAGKKGMNLAVDPGKNSSVDAKTGNKAQKVSIPAQKTK